MTMPAEKDSADQKAVIKVQQQAAEAEVMVVVGVQPLRMAQAEAADTALMAAVEENM